VLGYGLDDRGSRVRFPAEAGNFSLHHRVQNGSGAHPASSPISIMGSFPGVKQPGREADHSSPSSAEIKECVELYLHSPNMPSWHGAQLSTRTTLPLPRKFGSQYSYQATGWMAWFRFPARAGTFSLRHRVQNDSMESFKAMGYGGLFTENMAAAA
jgi:hypothetical protein